MQEIDLYEAISRTDDMKLRDIVIYGKIVKAIEQKGHLSKLVADGGRFVLVEVYGVQAKGQNYFSSQLALDTNLSLGTMVALCDDLSLMGENVRIYKSKGKGCDVRLGNRFNPTPSSVTCLTFIFDRNVEGNYRIQPNHFEKFGTGDEGSENGGEAVLLSSALAVRKGGEFSYPMFSGLPDNMVVEVDVPAEERTVKAKDEIPGSQAAVTKPSKFAELDSPPEGGLVSRKVITEVYPYVASFNEEIDRTRASREEFIEDRLAGSDLTDAEWKMKSILLGFYHGYVRQLNGRDANGERCKDVIGSVLKRMEIKNTDIDDIMKEIFAQPEFFYSKTGLHGQLDNRPMLCLSIIDEMIGTRFTAKVVNSEDPVGNYLLSLIENPYVHAMRFNGSLINADKAFFLFSAFGTEGIDKTRLTEDRDIVISMEVLTNFSVTASSIVPTHLLFDTGITVSKTVMFGVNNYGMPFTSKQNDLLTALLDDIKQNFKELDTLDSGDSKKVAKGYEDLKEVYQNFRLGEVTYQSLGWYKGRERFTPVNGNSFVKKLDNWGIGVHLEESNEIIASNYFEMEQYIYTKTRQMGETLSGVRPEHIQRAVMAYEDAKGFKLEELQKEAIEITLSNKAGVLTGQAGSGKTTVAEVMVLALRQSHPDYKVKFAAPTGKAANRMKEVLGDLGEVRTIHSLFKLGIALPSMFANNWEPRADDEKVVYIMDEMAMCTTDILYQIMKRMTPSSMIYFLGDIKQLPPIGKGLPFRDMLNYMPAKELGVSKRAKEGSGINYNCDIINQKSYASNFEVLKSFEDFVLVTEGDENVVNTLLNGVRAELKNYKGDDIQIATPYATPKKSHSSTNLNPILQDIFLPEEDVLFTYRGSKFKLGARVIHTKSNWRDKMRYSWNGKNTFEQIRSAGVVNGEVGKVIGIIPSGVVDFVFDEEFTNQHMEETGVELLDDIVEPNHQRRTVYVIFETLDADLGIPATLLYKATILGGGIEPNENEGALLSGGDIDKLELAYALTVHKLQGSQAKLVVIPFMSADNARFITRNMLYTAVSRAQEKVVLIGSVDGKNSMVSLSRRSTTVNSVKSMMSVMSGIDEL